MLLACLTVFNSCTKQFEKFNTDQNGVTNDQLIPDNNSIGSFYPTIQYAVGANDPSGSSSLAGGFEFLVNGAFSGMVMCPLPGSLDYNYDLVPGWEPYSLFNYGYNAVMSQVNNIKRIGGSTIDPDFWAIAKILQVAEMHKVTDIYGPVPYSHFGQGGSAVPYDAQEDIYNTFFSELDTAVNSLKTFIAANPNSIPFKKFDIIYGGDYSKWIKYANSLRLRLAMHIVKVDPVTAKLQAEKAVDPSNGGVITLNSDNAETPKGINPLSVVDHDWLNLTAGAALVTYMRGYRDPRIGVYFDPSVITPGQYVGLRAGSIIDNYQKLLEFSHTSVNNFSHSTPSILMRASEVDFLMAEGALRGWNMGGSTAQALYEEGIAASMSQWGVSASANSYISDGTSTPESFTDPYNAANNSPALSSITIKWNDADPNEQKLERIITQKWIALFPDVTEGWTNFRRTGYPKLFPVVVNNSGGKISTDIQIRRMIYLQSEYSTNSAEVAKAVMMLGGPDTGGTRVWWDIDKGNF
jgi:hypothetical protein